MYARRFALAVAVLAELIGSQAPEFAQQYRQRLGGALEELNRMIAEFDAEVRAENLTPAEGLSRLEANADPLARERGEDMAEAIDRAKRLGEQLQALTVRRSSPPASMSWRGTSIPRLRRARSTLTNPPRRCRSARSPPPVSRRSGAGRRHT